MKRRQFLRTGSLLGFASLTIPNHIYSNSFSAQEYQYKLDSSSLKPLADTALNAAISEKADYADIRIGRYFNQSISTREEKVIVFVLCEWVRQKESAERLYLQSLQRTFEMLVSSDSVNLDSNNI